MSKSHRPRRDRDNVDADDFRLACQMYRDGKGVVTIGAYLGRSDDVIQAWVGGLTRGSRTWKEGSAEEREMVRNLAGKVTLMELAGLVNRPPATVADWIAHPERGETRAALQQEREERVREINRLKNEEGLSRAEIAERLGTSYSTVLRALKD